jgi:glutathione S-transferase
MAGGPSIRLYRAEWSTNCERVGLALAHKGLGAQSVLIEYSDRSPVEAVSGQGLVPVIEDAGEVVNDSVAILRHLERRYPQPPLFPDDPGRQAELDLFIDWFERVYKDAPNAIEDELERDDPELAMVARRGAEMGARLAIFERMLDVRDFLFGELSVPQVRGRSRPGRHRALSRRARRPSAARGRPPGAGRVDRTCGRAPARVLAPHAGDYRSRWCRSGSLDCSSRSHPRMRSSPAERRFGAWSGNSPSPARPWRPSCPTADPSLHGI